jgi:peptidoglycan/LPS O-acetylase OafA/YrhL
MGQLAVEDVATLKPELSLEAKSALARSPADRHIPALDGLRGVAILSVMSFHYLNSTSYAAGSVLTRAVSALCSTMFAGVDLFFVLSGFLITSILLRERGAPHYFKNFYMRRVLRIFPLYYAALLVIFLIVPQFHAIDTPGVKRLFDTQGWLWAYSEDFAILVHNQDYFDPDWLWIGHFWSLAVEEHFYLVWPFLVFAFSGRRLLLVTAGLILSAPLLRLSMSAHGVDHAAVYVFTLCRTDELCCGAMVAILIQSQPYVRVARWARVGFAVSLLYFAGVLVSHHRLPTWGEPTTVGLGFSALAIGFASLIVFILAPGRTPLKRALELSPLRSAGKYSYGAYVFHTPMQPVYLWLFPPERVGGWAAGLGSSASHVAGLLGYGALAIGSTMALAFLSYWLFELRFLKLKRYFEYGRATASV